VQSIGEITDGIFVLMPVWISVVIFLSMTGEIQYLSQYITSPLRYVLFFFLLHQKGTLREQGETSVE
jgi:hypothetical protein